MVKGSTLARLKSYEERSLLASSQHIRFEEDRTIIYGTSQSTIYIPSNTGSLAHNDDNFVRLLMGPVGSGKTTWSINEIVIRASQMPYWHNGRRRSRCTIVRNTFGQLESTILKSWLMWFGHFPLVRKKQKPFWSFEYHFNDGNGIIELELDFMALDTNNLNYDNLKSYETTFVLLSEASELSNFIFNFFKARCNHRYPAKKFCTEDYWAGMFGDTNPPDEDHWMYRVFELEKPPQHVLYKQPPGLLKDETGKWIRNPSADNAENLSDDYYTMLVHGSTENYIKVFCLGQYGLVPTGKVVYPEYNDDLHSVDDIEAIQGEPIHLGWDGGLTPACVVIQISERGQFRILKEYLGEDMGIRTFAESVVMPSLVRDFPHCKIGKSVFDPSGAARNNILEEMSCIGELNSIGISTEAARTNSLEPRLSAVRFFLNRMVDGKPLFILSRIGAPTIRKGFIKGYVYKQMRIKNKKIYHDYPDKNEFSHPHDATQYIALEFASDFISKEKAEDKPIDMFNPVFRYL